tara:strand:+ start:59 stop:547 length:489 start_codon:yes stop_codon:yes gene_type:complete
MMHRQMPTTLGFSLLEVLIALVVLSVGLLGLAALQANGLRGSSSAFQRNQAVLMASDMADRMRANRAGLQYFTDNSPIALANGQNFGCSDQQDGTGEVEAIACTATQLARQAVFDWAQSMADTPHTGTITAVAGATNQFRIRVEWTDRGATGVQSTETDVQF